jgi:uncharacterized protein
MASTFLSAEWRKLIMAQYEVAPEVLAAWLPGGVELDLYQERCYVSLVGFLFDHVRVKGVPVPFHRRFTEVNLRFYVKRTMPDGNVRRGVVFISEIVPLPAITFVAKTLYGEPYRTAPVRWLWRGNDSGVDIGYSWKLPGRSGGKWQYMSVQADARARPIVAGSMEEFITDHYWGYTQGSGLLRRSEGLTGEYGVEHPQWECYPVSSSQISADFGALYGRPFAELTERKPDHVLLAEGSAVVVREGDAFRA